MQEATLTVTQAVIGAIGLMNAVNNGPKEYGIDQVRGNFPAYKALEIPYARVHDAAHCHHYGGRHSVDITCIFPDFSRDADDPQAYDFRLTDIYLETMRAAGTEPFYRLGQSIEHWKKKYGVNPPADFDKWAAICEHIVRHYNEGWADGFHWNIQYWEIWNEPDLNKPLADGTPSPTWTGTDEQFFQLFETTARRLKAAFPALKIGGPALAGVLEWADRFLARMHEDGVPLDFFSWHAYAVTPEAIADKAVQVRALMDKHGYGKAESILNEWNYVRGWTEDFAYSLLVESGDMNYKGAAFIAATMICCQHVPLDMLMFYDARIDCGMNNMFHHITLEPLRGYYPFLAWMRLRRLGKELAVKTENGDGIYAVAATDGNGRLGLLVVRYTDDDNVTTPQHVSIRADGFNLTQARCHITDKYFFYSEIVPETRENNAINFVLKPNGFAFIEL